MSRKSELVKVFQNFFQKLRSHSPSTIREQRFWLLRTFLINQKNSNWVNSGFILPTIAMVSLVVVLLTTAILFRSFERSKNASNVRVNEVTLKAATPALDRAKSKINKLFQPGSGLPRATPTDTGIENLLNNKIDEYTFGDETNLRLSSIVENVDKTKTQGFIRTAWRYPVDTDNNGKFDSYVLYGIYFKNPDVVAGKYFRVRNPLEARTPPMVAGKVTGGCNDILGTSATLVGSTGWSNIGGKLKKSFYVYTATVPITELPTGTASSNYEKYKGNKGFSAIEYQQDRVQLPLVNNAVVYEDDIALNPGPSFNLNGRIITNSNFITGGGRAGVDRSGINLYQVSSKDSCFYEAENAKIIVGGNLGTGGFTDNGDKDVTYVHLFKGKGTNPSTNLIVKDNKSVTDVPRDIAYNNLAYVQRINALVAAQTANAATTDPEEVKDSIEEEKRKSLLNGTTPTADDIEVFRQKGLRSYFKRRTRRVPYKEVPFGATQTFPSPLLKGSGDTLRPDDTWIYPTDPTDGSTAANYGKLVLNGSSGNYLPKATEPAKLAKDTDGKEAYVGDRALLGNNLPELWWNDSKKRFFSPDDLDTQEIKDSKWDTGTGKRTRRTRIEQLADLGKIERDGDWEQAAAQVPLNPQDPVGGLRVVTGTGIYLPSTLTLSSSSSDFTTAKTATDKIWSDLMPVPSETPTNVSTADNRDIPSTPPTLIRSFDYTKINVGNAPYLRMRATAVYHYKSTGYDQKNPKPIACVSSYYDPTNENTAKNLFGLPYADDENGNSNNGVVYSPPTKTETSYTAILNYQKDLKYPNGRLVNEGLKTALDKLSANRTIADKSIIDAAICSLQILDKSISPSTTAIPHGAIRETAFLDGRQVKAVHADNSVTSGVLETFTNADNGAVIKEDTGGATGVGIDYDLPVEQRQPLEIRTTVLDIDLLRKKTIGGTDGGQEYLVPNSGIIYATRDDALLDLSATKPTTGTDTQKEEAQKETSRVDFKLDPTRRPNGIMLVNGDKLWREEDFREVEKGFILASNLPVYIKGNFNRHTQFEFGDSTDKLKDDWSNFYSRAASDRNVNFACRKEDKRLPKCTVGDEWRPASVLSDAVNLLSNNYREGYRNEGDYDLNNHLGDQASIADFKANGFGMNAYVTNADWYDTTGTNEAYPKDRDSTSTKPGLQGSSYLNTFVTPVQRRAKAGEFNEYLMEVCPKLPVSACTPDDWKIDPNQAVGKSNSWNFGGDTTKGIIGKKLVTEVLLGKTVIALSSDVKSGTTALAADSAYKNFPRRVAFKRDSSGGLVLDANTNPTKRMPIPLGIDKDGKVQEYPYTSTASPRLAPGNALWFKTTTNANDPTKDNESVRSPKDPPVGESEPGKVYYPLLRQKMTVATKENPELVPVLQITTPFGTPSIPNGDRIGDSKSTNYPDRNANQWLQPASETTFNLAATGGDVPARPTEDNGGLHNFVRFLENWDPDQNDPVKARISGSFIQTGRSAYATAPFSTSLDNDAYSISGGSGRLPYYMPPTRQWGYDVGLLSQSPDLFAQKLVRVPDDLPDEFFREVGKDDEWVKNLLCAEKLKVDSSNLGNPKSLTPDGDAVDSDQRPKCN
jgi:hypothetical protein